MKPFTYLAPETLSDAVRLISAHSAQGRLIAGGQNLLLDLKTRAARPAYLVSLRGIRELQGWRYTDDALEIGATTTYAALARAPFAGWHAEIAGVAGNLADRSVRSMGTIGGAACQAEPRYDVPNLLVGVDASLVLVSEAGERLVPASAFFSLAGGTTIAAGEILKSIVLPPLDRYSGVAFEKFRVRTFDAALVSVCCALKTGADGSISTARISVGAVEKAPSLAEATARALLENPPSSLDLRMLGEQAADEILPDAHATTRPRRYQRELIKTLVRDAIARASGLGG